MINEVLESVKNRLIGTSNLYSTKLTKGQSFAPAVPVVSVSSVRGSGSRLRLSISVIIKHDSNVTLHTLIEAAFLALNNFKINDGVVLLDSGEINSGSDGFYAVLLFQYTALVPVPETILETALLQQAGITFNENCEE